MRKQIFFTLILAFMATAVLWCQVTDQGNFVIGSTLGFSTANSKVTQEVGDAGATNEERPFSVQLNIAPKVGYFLVDNFALGIGVDYTLNRIEEGGEEKVKDSDLLFGPFGRYYFPVGDDMAFLIEAGFGFGNATDVVGIAGTRQSITTNIFAFGVGPGFTIVSSESIGLEASVKYNYAHSSFDTEIGGVRQKTRTDTNQFDFSVGVQFYFSRIVRATGG